MRFVASSTFTVICLLISLLATSTTVNGQSSTCNCAEPPGGFVSCDKGLVPVCVVKDGKTIGFCLEIKKSNGTKEGQAASLFSLLFSREITIEELSGDTFQNILRRSGLRAKDLSITFRLDEQPEVVTLSEIFIEFSGKDESKIKEKVADLEHRVRAGEDFNKLALEYSDRKLIQNPDGRPKRFRISELPADIAAAIKGVPAGKILDTIRLKDGFLILKVEERVPDVSLDNLPLIRFAVDLKRLKNSPSIHEQGVRKGYQ